MAQASTHSPQTSKNSENVEPKRVVKRKYDMHTAAASGPIMKSNEMSAQPRTRAVDSARPPTVVSFDEFYNTEREGLIRAVTLVVGSPVTAADVVDEALLRAYQRWPELAQRPRPGGWVFRVAVNLGRSRYRRLQREIKYRWLSLPATGVDETAEAAFAERIEDDRLLGAVLRLSVEQRAVLVARILLDYSEAEVASNLDISVGTVKSRLSRALEALRRELPDLDPSLGRYLTTESAEAATSQRRPPARQRRSRPRTHGAPTSRGVSNDSSHGSSNDSKGLPS